MCVWKVEKSSVDEDIKQVLSRHRENLEKTVSSLKMKLARSAEEHDQVYVKLMKVQERRSLCFSLAQKLTKRRCFSSSRRT